MTAAQTCLIVAGVGVAELGAALFFLRKHLSEKQAASTVSPTTIEHVSNHKSAKQGQSLMLAGVGLMSALISFGIAGYMWFAVAPMSAARDQAAKAFVEAARSKDSARIKQLSANGASVDDAFLTAQVASAKSVEATDYDLAFGGESCMEFATDSDARFWLHLEEQDGSWLISRAGPKDPECENQLHSD